MRGMVRVARRARKAMGLWRRTLELRQATCKTWKSQALFRSTEHESCGGMVAFIGGLGFFFF
jgi:hypothetical protein